MTKILIADDEALVRGGMAVMLSVEDDFEIVGEAIDGADAVEQALLRRPDVVLMDIRMPNVDGIEATRRLASPKPGARPDRDHLRPRRIRARGTARRRQRIRAQGHTTRNAR